MFSNPKSIQASVTLLEKLPVILDKSTEEDMRNLVLPLLFNSLESKMSQIQVCNVTCLTQFIWYYMQGYVYFRFTLILLHLLMIIFLTICLALVCKFNFNMIQQMAPQLFAYFGRGNSFQFYLKLRKDENEAKKKWFPLTKTKFRVLTCTVYTIEFRCVAVQLLILYGQASQLWLI